MNPTVPDRTDQLFDLLPLVHRMRDEAAGGPLRDLLRVIAEQVEVVEDDIAGLYDNWFIETADDWVVPYLADLVGWTPVDDAGALASVATGRDLARNAALVPRRDVANTMGHRRRKGTRALLEDLAGDVAGWPGRAVEFYRLLRVDQQVNHLQLGRGRSVDVREVEALELLDGPFDQWAHSVDVRRISSRRTPGRYNIPSVGLFVWRLGSYSVTRTPACEVERVGRWAFTFDAVGFESPLFTAPAEGERRAHPAGPADVPGEIGRRAFEVVDDHRRHVSPDLYGRGRSLVIEAPNWPRTGEGFPVPAKHVIPADLSDWDRYRPLPDTVAVDPVLGRMVFPRRNSPRSVRVTYHYGFSADIGGGEYDRPIPDVPASVTRRFVAGQVLDPAGLIESVLGREPLAASIVAGHWPGGRVPEKGASVPDLVEALNEALEDPALNANPLAGDDLLVANRQTIEEAWPTKLATAHWHRLVEDGRGLEEALRHWDTAKPSYGVIELTESTVYSIAASVEVGAGQSLVIRAVNRKRPIIWLADRRSDGPDALSFDLHRGARLTLDGLMVAGRPVHLAGVRDDPGSDSGHGQEHDRRYVLQDDSGYVRPDDPGNVAPNDTAECVVPTRVVIRHCSLVPGWAPIIDCDPSAAPSLELVGLDEATVTITHSIVGTIQVVADRHASDPLLLDVSDSILDATEPELEAIGGGGPSSAYVALNIARTTVFGVVDVHAIALGENTIFEGLIRVARRGVGCLRFSSVVPGSRTPRRFHCQPDLAVAALGLAPDPEEQAAAELRVRPQFTSTRYRDPGYAQLSCACPDEIARGADDESEMGAFHDLYQPQRTAALRARADEYTPAGMDVAVIPVT